MGRKATGRIEADEEGLGRWVESSKEFGRDTCKLTCLEVTDVPVSRAHSSTPRHHPLVRRLHFPQISRIVLCL